MRSFGHNSEFCSGLLLDKERNRLQIEQTKIGDFDLLIGCTPLHYDLTVLTNNRKNFQKIEAIQIESL